MFMVTWRVKDNDMVGMVFWVRVWLCLSIQSRVTGGNIFLLSSTTHHPHSVVRAFAHGAMGRRIDPSWWTH